MLFANPFRRALVDPRFGRMVRPCGNRRPHRLQDPRRRADGEAIRNRQQILPCDAREVAVHRHQVLVGPLAFGVVREGHVVRGGQLPSAAFP